MCSISIPLVCLTQEARYVFNKITLRRIGLLAKVQMIKYDVYEVYRTKCVRRMFDILSRLLPRSKIIRPNEMYLAIDKQNGTIVVSRGLHRKIPWHLPFALSRLRRVAAATRITTRAMAFCAHLINLVIDRQIPMIRKEMSLYGRKRMTSWPTRPARKDSDTLFICSRLAMRRHLRKNGIPVIPPAMLTSCLTYISDIFREMISRKRTPGVYIRVFDIQQYVLERRDSLFGGRHVYDSVVTPVYHGHHIGHLSLRKKKDKTLRRIRDSIAHYPPAGQIKREPFRRLMKIIAPHKYSKGAVSLLKAYMERYIFETFRVAKQVAFINKRNILHSADLKFSIAVS